LWFVFKARANFCYCTCNCCLKNNNSFKSESKISLNTCTEIMFINSFFLGNNVPTRRFDGREIWEEFEAWEATARTSLSGETEGRRVLRTPDRGQLRLELQACLASQDQHHVRSPLHQGAVVGSDRDDGAGGHDGNVLDPSGSFLSSYRGNQDPTGSPQRRPGKLWITIWNQGGDSQDLLCKFVRFFVSLGRKISRLFRFKVLFEADIMKRW